MFTLLTCLKLLVPLLLLTGTSAILFDATSSLLKVPYFNIIIVIFNVSSARCSSFSVFTASLLSRPRAGFSIDPTGVMGEWHSESMLCH